MNILMLGGTGAMGAYLKDILVRKGHFVNITSRRQRVDEECIHYIQGNAMDINFLLNVLKNNYDVIVDFMKYTTKEFTERSEILLNATSQYVFISSARVFADSEYPISETSQRILDVCDDIQYLSTDEYALTKARQENLLFESIHSNWCIMRPYITYSNTRLQLGIFEKEDWLYRILQNKPIVFSNDIAKKVTTMTYGEDVAKVIAELIGNDNALGKAVNLAGNQSMLWNEVLELYFDVIEQCMGFRPQVIITKSSEKMKYAMKKQYQVDYDRLYNRTFDNALVEHICGHPIQFTPMQDGLKRCMKEFLSNPLFRPISGRYQGYADNVCHTITAFSEIPAIKEKCKYLYVRFFTHEKEVLE